MRWNLLKCCRCLLPALLLLPVTAWPAEFSAQMIVKDGDKIMPGKIYVQDGLMRQEFNDESGQTITVVRPDKKVVWVILPRERAYMELPLKARLPGQFIQMPPDAAQKRLLGKETVNGYETEKYQVSVRSGEGVEFQTIWVAPKLGMPLKMVVDQRKFSIEYRSIREGKQSDRWFALPPGYQKLASPAGFADKLDN
jgi:outer membrane lipoprotein-sorting protein